MIWLTKLFLLTQVVLGIQQRDVYASNITWEPTNIPLVFGKDVGIRCTYHNTLSCNDPIIWTWYIGTDNDLILTNGILTEKFKSEHKYSEITSSCSQTSTLIVSNFNERDYNQTYRCGIANHNQSGKLFAENIQNKITFKNTLYEYVPSDEMISTEIKLLKNQKLSFRVEIDRVYPLPDCKAAVGENDFTHALQIKKKKKNLFYHISIDLTLYHASMVTIGNMCIKCKGTGSWLYLTKNWNPYCTNKLTTDESGLFLAVCIDFFSMSYLASSTVVLLVLYCSRNDKFEMRMKFLIIVESIHCVLAFGIWVGYTSSDSNVNEGRFRLQVQYGHTFHIIQRLGGFKFLISVVVMIIVARAAFKTKNIYNKIDCLPYTLIMVYFAVIDLIMMLLSKETTAGSVETNKNLYSLLAVQLFLPVRLICTVVLRRFHNIGDKELDSIRETQALLKDEEHDGESFCSGSSETNGLLKDKGQDAESCGSYETQALSKDEEHDGESYCSGSSEKNELLRDKGQDAESYGSGSSGSYNTAFESSNDEEMCFAESEF